MLCQQIYPELELHASYNEVLHNRDSLSSWPILGNKDELEQDLEDHIEGLKTVQHQA